MRSRIWIGVDSRRCGRQLFREQEIISDRCCDVRIWNGHICIRTVYLLVIRKLRSPRDISHFGIYSFKARVTLWLIHSSSDEYQGALYLNCAAVGAFFRPMKRRGRNNKSTAMKLKVMEQQSKPTRDVLLDNSDPSLLTLERTGRQPDMAVMEDSSIIVEELRSAQDLTSVHDVSKQVCVSFYSFLAWICCSLRKTGSAMRQFSQIMYSMRHCNAGAGCAVYRSN